MSEYYTEAPIEPDSLDVLGLRLHCVDVGQVHTYIEKVISASQKALVLNLNINCVNLAHKHAWLKDFLNRAQMIFCDGDGVRWGVQLLGQSPPVKITYDRWIWQLAAFAAEKNFRFYFLGAKPGVAAEAAARLREKFPQLQIAGTKDGYFNKQGPENDAVIEEINASKCDILVLGFGMPMQEKWLAENWQRTRAHVALTGGAVFDYVSGRAKRAPDWMIRANLEWLFRLIQEPRRLFVRYLLGNPTFFFKIIEAKWDRKKTTSKK